jgi:hypothetical protein
VVVFECHCAWSPAPSIHSAWTIRGKGRDGNFMQALRFFLCPADPVTMQCVR